MEGGSTACWQWVEFFPSVKRFTLPSREVPVFLSERLSGMFRQLKKIYNQP